MGPTHDNQNGPGVLKKGGRLKSPHRVYEKILMWAFCWLA